MKIYLKLLNEDIEVLRPVDATQINNETYLLKQDQIIPPSEEWEFLPGEKVKCTPIEKNGEKLLLCIKRV